LEQLVQSKASGHQTAGSIRLVQISDCHLCAAAATLYRGENADAGLLSVLQKIATWQPQLVLASGDLSEDASAASYQRLAGYLQTLGAPVCVLPGNHDNEELMQRYFHRGPWTGPLILQAGAWRLVLLSSVLAGHIEGAISPGDIEQLRDFLETGPQTPVLIALHHQPVPVGAQWIDRYMLRAPEALLGLLADHDEIRALVWGHVHQAFETTIGSTRLLACPSTAANSVAGALHFTRDPAGPACRWLQLKAQGALATGLWSRRATRSDFNQDPTLSAGQNQPENQVNEDAGKGSG